jgi:CO dehydrogenase/acetyl-CoA synthase beta subunit
MEPKAAIEKIREFLKKEQATGKILLTYQSTENQINTYNNTKIKIGLNKFKEIILEEETGLELGGMNKKSFSLVIPIEQTDLINPGIIRLLGREVNIIEEPKIDFGIVILIGIHKNIHSSEEELRHLNFISNGIEGFSIRTIPRRFWCRISNSALQKGFSFEILGNAIVQLYKQKFPDLVNSVEVMFINSYPSSIDQFIVLSSEILAEAREKWKKKIEEWRKRIDCDYDWGCEICPYQEECYDVKQVLVSREEIKD